jgi:integrase
MPTLSEDHIKKAEKPEKGNRLVFDDHKDAPRGFGLRITSAGGKAFILRYRPKASGRDRLMTIGQWPTWSLSAARAKAGEFKREIDGGKDILEDRRLERQRPLLEGVVEEYCETVTDSLVSGPQIKSALTRYLVAGIGASTKFSDIRRSDVRGVVEDLAKKHPRQAALLLTYTKGLFAWAEDKEKIDVNPVATLKPGKIDKAMSNRNFVRGRCLDDNEIKALWTKVETCGMHRLTALALKLVLVTGQRPGEVAGMRWSEVKGSTWTIPETRRGKTATAHVVPLTDTALEVLMGAKAEVLRLTKRRGRKPSGYVFETRPGNSPAVNAIDRAVKRFAADLGNKDAEKWGHWTPHDLRRTCRTGLSAAGVGEVIAELTIGHTRKGIAAVYDLHRYDMEKRHALEVWERRLKQILAGEQLSSNVISATFGR